MMQKQYISSQKVFNHEWSYEGNLYGLCISYAIQPTKSLRGTFLFWEANSSTGQEIPHIFATPNVISILTSNHHFSLSWANTFLRCIFILDYHLCLGLSSGLFPSPTKTMYIFILNCTWHVQCSACQFHTTWWVNKSNLLTLLILMSGTDTAWSPSRPIVPPVQVTMNKVPTFSCSRFVSLTMILIHGGQPFDTSEKYTVTNNSNL